MSMGLKEKPKSSASHMLPMCYAWLVWCSVINALVMLPLGQCNREGGAQ